MRFGRFGQTDCGSFADKAQRISSDYDYGRITLDEAVSRSEDLSKEAKALDTAGTCSGTIWDYEMSIVMNVHAKLLSERAAQTYQHVADTYEGIAGSHQTMAYVLIGIGVVGVAAWAITGTDPVELMLGK